MPMATAESRTAGSTPRMSGHGIAQNRQQRIDHQRDDRRMLPDAADERDRDQETKERQAGNGLADVSNAESDAAERAV